MKTNNSGNVSALDKVRMGSGSGDSGCVLTSAYDNGEGCLFYIPDIKLRWKLFYFIFLNPNIGLKHSLELNQLEPLY